MIELKGTIENITYSNDDNGFTIAKVKSEGDHGFITVVGSLMAPPVGTSLKMWGEWNEHPRFGRQFKVDHFETAVPATAAGIRKYLGSGLIQGLGKKMAERIVKKFGTATLDIIENDIDKLSDVEGIGEKRIAMIKKAWDDQKEIRDVMIFLQSHGVSTGFATKIFKHYQGRSIEVVKENPYCLATDIIGIGFKTADIIAANIGFAKDSPFRISAGILYTLRSAGDDGHVYYPYDLLASKCIELLGVNKDGVDNALALLIQERRVIVEELHGDVDDTQEKIQAVYLAPFFFCERGVAVRLKEIIGTSDTGHSMDPASELLWVQQRLSIELAPKQLDAVKTALESKVMVITGGPGTGKTTIINAVLKIFARHDYKILLAAPTGRAAKRLSETTGRTAKTIHRLLEFSFSGGGFQKNNENQLNCDGLVIDEASMIDINLMFQLLKAVPAHAIIILVGDVNQLPSVGAGNVLNDIIDSGVVAVVKLTEIFRQARESMIVVNAHKINSGMIPQTGNFAAGDDFYFIEQSDPERVVSIIIELVNKRIPRRFNHDSFEDIQVLTPMHKGTSGSENLNNRLQEALNDSGISLERGERTLKVNDKVMQIKNNYDKDVFNGDIGRIKTIDTDEQTVVVLYEGKEVGYSYADLDEIVLAYAVSVHKSQGSEYPVVVMPVTTQHYILLQRNLIYTGVTRGRELVVLVGTKKALAMGIKNNKTAERYTHLKYRLRG